ncbi:MAG: tetratricopeptide repeat protein [Gammaproteobacteria bacterium]|nr:tetratricopeptide repeat protein [Gammaproteobacteria bacterium]NVK86981.1 tetratricopeptide repeat protein [Gammaproteobacteria bacterium]
MPEMLLSFFTTCVKATAKRARPISLLMLGLSVFNQATAVTSDNALATCEAAMQSGDYAHAETICYQQLTQLQTQASATPTASSELAAQQLMLQLALVDIFHAMGDSSQEDLFLKQARANPAFSHHTAGAYKWHRKMGQKYYFIKDYRRANEHLEQALTIAKQQNDRSMLAKSYNDVGLVQSQQGNFKQALASYQQSLALKLEQGDNYPIGTTLNNIGLTYAKLENYEQAIHYYEQALDTFLKYTQQPNFDRRVFNNITHVYEDLAVTYNKLDDLQKQAYFQQKAMASIDYKTSKGEQARALINIAQLQIDENQLDSAESFLTKAEELQTLSAFDLRLELNVSRAELSIQKNELDKAISFANSGLLLATEKADHFAKAKLLKILSRAYYNRDIHASFHYLEQYAQSRDAFLAQKYDADLKSIQVAIEKQQVEHQLALEQIENARQQTEIQQLTNWILSASLLLSISIAFLVLFWFKKKKEKQALIQSIRYHQQQLLALEHSLQDDDTDTEATDDNEDVELAKSMTQLKQQLRSTLVATMIDAVRIWETHTQSNRVELADKSKLWTISIDSGTLRTRSLDKYLSIDKIPANPRWRAVASTCHFILSDADLDSGDRATLNRHLDTISNIVKAQSLYVD